MPICCVAKCNNRNGSRFPRDEEMKKKWLMAIRRETEFVVKSWTIVCWSHFRPDDFLQENYYTGAPLTTRKLKKGVVPSVFVWKKQPPHIRQAPARHRPPRCLTDYRPSDPSPSPSCESQETSTRLSFGLISSDANRSVPRGASVHSCATDRSESTEHQESLIAEDVCEVVMSSETTQPLTRITVNRKGIPTKPRLKKHAVHSGRVKKDASTQTKMKYTTFSVENFKSKPTLFLYYTGLESYEKFSFVWGTLGPAVSQLNYRDRPVVNVSPEDQFLVALIKLRRATPDFELGVMFDVSENTIGNIFTAWVLLMSLEWKEMNIWPSVDLVSHKMPEDFMNIYHSTGVIVDGTEIPVRKPASPVHEQAERQKSDRKDSVVADGGFTVQDIFGAKDIALNIPAFLKGRYHLRGTTVLADRKSASKRVHTKSVVGMAKTYKILKYELSPNYLHLASQIFFCCAMLCNFREGLVSETA